MLCLFTRSLKQVLMRTKGIRQAEGESPYTVKTKGAIRWKEDDSVPFSCPSTRVVTVVSTKHKEIGNRFGGRVQIG